MGLNFKLDVGFSQVGTAGRLLSVIGHLQVDAKTSLRDRFVAAKEAFVAAFVPQTFATAVA